MRALLVCLLISSSCAVITVPSIFGDNMVLQTNNEYGSRAFINGFSDPEEVVKVNLAGTTYETTADSTGAWKVMLNPHTSGLVHTLTVTGASGPPWVAKNVMYGDVFVCSGQSNMEFPMSISLNASAEIATAANWPNFRLFKVNHSTAAEPQKNLHGQWEVLTTKNVASFSAVCYLSVREIARLHTHNRPMGLIQSTWGGTRVESWMSKDALTMCDHPPLAGHGPNVPTVLYNAMIAPMNSVAVRAALWYQGECNASGKNSTSYYSCMFQAMIADWRVHKGIGDFAFNFVQLPPSESATSTADHGRPAVRAAQAEALTHPGGKTDIAGMAVTLDMGGISAWGIDHPPNKPEIARRLALQTLHTAYALQYPNLVFSGPILSRLTATSITFEDTTNDGLHFASTLNCSTCCEKSSPFQQLVDGTWQRLDAKVKDGTTLSIDASKASRVRYAWTDFVQCVLKNEAGLLLSPFDVKVSFDDEPLLPRTSKESMPLSPPMGYNTWNYYHCNVDESEVRSIADMMVTNGMKAVGYEFVNLDDCWQVARRANGTIVEDPSRFPSGMKALADYVHSKGLKFGVYTARGSRTCQDRPGAYQHEAIDGATYCEWGLDYLKNDDCGGSGYKNATESWAKFQDAFDECQKKTGRFTTKSIEYCKDPKVCGKVISEVANLWRTCHDIQANWDSVMSNLDLNNKMASVARPGHFNDPDMLQVGNVGLSFEEQRTHFAMWCIVSAPLLVATDLTRAEKQTIDLLTSTEAIAINQDLGRDNVIQGKLVTAANSSGTEVWSKPMADTKVTAVALLNRSPTTTTITIKLDVLGLSSSATVTVRDVLKETDLGTFTGSFHASVPSHGVVLVTMTEK